MDISTAPDCDPNPGLQQLTLSAVTGTLTTSLAGGTGRDVGRPPSTSHHVTVSESPPPPEQRPPPTDQQPSIMHEPPATVTVTQQPQQAQQPQLAQQEQAQQQQEQAQQQMENRSVGELPAALFCGGPDPSRIPGLVIEQVSVSVGSTGVGRPPPPQPPPSEEVIVVDVDLGAPAEDGAGRPPLHLPAPVSAAAGPGAADGAGDELSELRAGRRCREPALPPMETLRPTDEVTLTPVTLPGVCRAAPAPVAVSVGGEPHYDVIMSSCLRNGPLVQLNTSDLEVLPLPAPHAPLDVASFCNDSSDGIGALTDKLGSPPKLELLGAVPLQLPHVEPPLAVAAVSAAATVSTATRLPPPYPQRTGPASTARLSALCQQLTERVEAHKCALCSFVSLQRRDVSAHLLSNHRVELERRKSTSRRAGRSPPPPPARVVSATSQAHCVVNAHGRVRVQPRPPPQEAPAAASPEVNVESMDDSCVGGAASPTEPASRFEATSGVTESDDVEVMWMGGGSAVSVDTEQQPVEARAEGPEATEAATEAGEAVAEEAEAAAAAAEAAAEDAEAEAEDDPDPMKTSRLLGLVSAIDPSLLKGKKRGRPRDSRSLGVSALGGGRGRPQRQIEKELGLLSCKEPDCGLRLRDREKLELHQRCHLANNPSEFRCTECGHTTKKWRAMSLHLWREHRMDCDLYHCDLCDYKTARYSQLVNVHRPTHGQSRNFTCPTCHKAFKSSKQLQNHRAKHRHKNDPAYVESCRCDICNSVLSDRRALALHKQMVHEKRRQFQCKSCGNVFSCRSSLVMHERQHSGQKPFVCEECPYSSTDHNTMRRHKMRHTGERPYKCPHCSYSCIQSSTYKKHLRVKHPGAAAELVFSCHVCIFKTIQRSAYIRHMQEHPDAGPPPEPAPYPPPGKLPLPPLNRSQPPPPPPPPLALMDQSGEMQQHVVRVHEAPPPPLPVVSEVTGAVTAIGPPGQLKVAAVGGAMAATTVYQLVPQGSGRPLVLTPTQLQLVTPPGPIGKPAKATRGSRSTGSRRTLQ